MDVREIDPAVEKRCSKCEVIKPLDDFYFSRRATNTRQPRCKDCARLKRKKEYWKNREKELKRRSEYRLKHYDVEMERKREHYYRNRDRELERAKKYREANLEACKQRRLDHYHNNPTYYRERNARRRSAKLQRTPSWLTKEDLKEMREIYKNCPEGYHVDHIIPLQGKNVSGLHVPSNLQYLPSKENIAKGNKF